jgi:tetratricopeptide (TPR) repeat protein
MRRTLIISFAALLLASLVSCRQKQAGLAEYHEALSLIDQGDAPAALTLLEKAGQLATTDSLRALVESQKGTLFFNQHLLDRSLTSYQRAYTFDQRASDTLGLIYDLRDMGNVYRSQDNDSCLACFRQARELAIAFGHLPMQRDVESQMAGYYLYHDSLQEARALLLPALAYTDSANASGLHFMMADLYHRSGIRDSATLYYRKILAHGSLYARRGAHRHLADYALDMGNTEEANAHMQQFGVLTDSMLGENDAEALRRMTALYDYSLRERENVRLEKLVMFISAAALVLILVLTFIIFYYRKKREVFRLRLKQMELLVAEHQNKPERLTAEERSALNRTAIVRHIQGLLADIHQPTMTNDDWQQLEELFVQSLPQFLPRLQEFCQLSLQERRVSMLLRLGNTPTDIAQLTAHSKQSVANTRSRLFEKAFGRKGSPADWDQLVASL